MASAESSALSGSDELILIDLVPGVASFFAFQNVTVIVWHARPDVETVEQMGKVSEKRRKQHPKGISVVHMIKGQFELPDGPTREAFVRVINQGEGTLALVAILVFGRGFWASAVRSLVTGIRVLSRGTFDLGLHGEIDGVVKWMPPKHSARTGVTLAPEALERALRRAQAFVQPGRE